MIENYALVLNITTSLINITLGVLSSVFGGFGHHTSMSYWMSSMYIRTSNLKISLELHEKELASTLEQTTNILTHQ